MKRLVTTCLALACLTSSVAAGTIFVMSSPQGATVTVNGESVDQVTPLLIDAEAERRILIEAALPGHVPAEIVLEADAEYPVEVNLALVPDFVLTGFPEDESSLRLLADVPEARFVRLPQGTYTIERSDTGVVVTPRFAGDPFIGALSLGAAIGLGTTMTSLFSDLDREGTDRISPATLVSGLATLGLFVADVVLLVRRASFYATLDPVVVPVNPLDAQLLLERAEIALEAGSLAFAEESLGAYVELVPQGERVAESLYRQARILVSTGEFGRALPVYERLIANYPDPEFYDRAILGLAEAYGRIGDPAQGIETLSMVTFVRSAPSREEVALQRADLFDLLAFTQPDAARDRVDAWVDLISGYPDSSDAEYYVLMAADAMLDAGRAPEAAELIAAYEGDESLEQLYLTVQNRLREAGY